MKGAQRTQHERHFHWGQFHWGERTRGAGRRLAGVPLLSAVACAFALACGGGGGGGGGPTGKVLVAVQATAAGSNYRLQNGTLTGAGVEAFTLDTDATTQASMSHDLVPGAYTLKLEDGWTLARQMGAGSFMPVTATLTSANPVSFNVLAAMIARVGFTFDAGGTSVDLQAAADDIDNNDE